MIHIFHTNPRDITLTLVGLCLLLLMGSFSYGYFQEKEQQAAIVRAYYEATALEHRVTEFERRIELAVSGFGPEVGHD